MNLNKNYLSKLSIAYVYYILIKNKIYLTLINESDYNFLTDDLKRISVCYSMKTEHRTIKNGKNYIYNIWEVNIELFKADFLILLLFDNLDDEIKELGLFIFPKEVIENLKDKKSLTIFESDIYGNYRKEPKFNKHKYFNNFSLLLPSS